MAHGRASASGAARALTPCAFVPRAFASHAFAPRAFAPRACAPVLALAERRSRRSADTQPLVGAQPAVAQVSQAGKVALSSDSRARVAAITRHTGGRVGCPVAHVRRVHSRQSHRSARPARSCPARTRRAHVAVITRRSRRLPGGTCRAHVGRGRARWFGVTTSLTLAGRCGRSACRPSGLQIEAAAATAVMWGVYYLRACVCVCAWCCAHACASVHMRSSARACRHARTRKHVRAHTHT